MTNQINTAYATTNTGDNLSLSDTSLNFIGFGVVPNSTTPSEYVWMPNPNYLQAVDNRRYIERQNLLTYGLNPLTSTFKNLTITKDGYKVGYSAQLNKELNIYRGAKYFAYCLLKLTDPSKSAFTIAMATNEPVRLTEPSLVQVGDEQLYRYCWADITTGNQLIYVLDNSDASNSITIVDMGVYNLTKLNTPDSTTAEQFADYLTNTKHMLKI